MIETRRNCVLWSGGKDCFLAYALSLLQPSDTIFVTFVPREGIFRCHPLGLLMQQGRMLNVRHEFVVIEPQEWLFSYRRAFAFLRDTYSIQRVITGDIHWEEKAAANYWLRTLLVELDLELRLPLMGLYAEDMFELLAERQIIAPITAIRQEFFRSGLLGQPVSLELLHSKNLRHSAAFDICGERGEYHTTVVRFADLEFSACDFPGLEYTLAEAIWAPSIVPDLHELAQSRIRPLDT